MKTKISVLTILLSTMVGLSNIANAQSPILEKTYDVSGKAKRGFLAGVEMNKEKETFDMFYVLPTFFEAAGNSHSGVLGSGMGAEMPCEVYSYDKDLNFLSSSKMGVQPGSHSWANYKGLYSYEVVRGTANLGGISFQKLERQYLYEPRTGEYTMNREKVLDREKPKTPDGNKYSLQGGIEVYDVIAERTALMILGKKLEKSEATKKNYLHLCNHLMKFDVLKCDKDLNITTTDTLSFDFVSKVLYSGQIKDQRNETNDDLARDWVLIFGPPIHNTPIFRNPKSTDWTYVRISPQGKVLEKIQFNSPVNLWNIEGVYEKDNAVYLYGSGVVEKSEKNYYVNIRTTSNKEMAELDFTHYQVGKISKGKFDFLKAYSLKDMQAKMSKPNRKKTPEITGQSESSTGITIVNNGDMYITYQDYDFEKEGKNIHENYLNKIFMFQFDADGNLKKNFGLEIPEYPDLKRAKPAKNYFYTSGDGKSLYWFLNSYKREHNGLRRIDYSSINFETGEFSEMKTFGKEKKNEFFLYGTAKPHQLGNYVYFFSEDQNEKNTGGDNIRLTRVDISK